MIIQGQLKGSIDDFKRNISNLSNSKMSGTHLDSRYYHDSRLLLDWLDSTSILFSDDSEKSLVQLITKNNNMLINALNLDYLDAYRKFKSVFSDFYSEYLRAYLKHIQKKGRELYSLLQQGVFDLEASKTRTELMRTLLPLKTNFELNFNINSYDDSEIPSYFSRNHPYSMRTHLVDIEDIIRYAQDLNVQVKNTSEDTLTLSRMYRTCVSNFISQTTSLLKHSEEKTSYDLIDSEGVVYNFSSYLDVATLTDSLDGVWLSQTTHGYVDFVIKKDERIVLDI